jgi:hypothetical protein
MPNVFAFLLLFLKKFDLNIKWINLRELTHAKVTAGAPQTAAHPVMDDNAIICDVIENI